MILFFQELLEDVPVVQIGSVFKSWELLKPGPTHKLRDLFLGFEKLLRSHLNSIKKVSFYELTESAALGAALLAAKNAHADVDFDYNTKKYVDSIVL